MSSASSAMSSVSTTRSTLEPLFIILCNNPGKISSNHHLFVLQLRGFWPDLFFRFWFIILRRNDVVDLGNDIRNTVLGSCLGTQTVIGLRSFYVLFSSKPVFSRHFGDFLLFILHIFFKLIIRIFIVIFFFIFRLRTWSVFDNLKSPCFIQSNLGWTSTTVLLLGGQKFLGFFLQLHLKQPQSSFFGF